MTSHKNKTVTQALTVDGQQAVHIHGK